MPRPRVYEPSVFKPLKFNCREDAVKTTEDAASDQGQQDCYVTDVSMRNTIKVYTFTRNPLNKKWTNPNKKDRHVHWSKMG